ncbi:WD40 repeat domain-containing protein [Nonomuraea rhodomycinica]|uniref:WD domain-containing protein, G-beta repeat-containing protein n=1 Tax=Nonomuraea rhodomycinica TaxID=1712872 RepID=A0A7Y6IW30_9ACTN|nr:hypothetical protein [Nonomuraea rhodomycinica]NUW45133.1 hypothetical protein [Nonomuraea rhodomycinica]
MTGEPEQLVRLTGRTPLGHDSAAYTTAFSPDGRLLLTGSHEYAALLWDVSEPRRPVRVATLGGHQSQISAAAFSPTGDVLATGAVDESVVLWSLDAEP